MKFIRTIYDWMGSKVYSPYANWWLFLLFFIEASFFLIPVDPLLIVYAVHRRSRAWWYALLATTASVIGGLFGYLIGAVLWQSVGSVIVHWLISEKVFAEVVARYTHYQAWAVLLGAFTPVPYKAITISAGFCHLPLLPFILCSFIGRGARFFLIAGAIHFWGAGIKDFIEKYFNYLVIAFAAILALGVMAIFH
jgi:membrane protein YqaA with SNARE-associated domain